MNPKEQLIRRRFREYKRRHANAILLLRIGDLYNAICEDAPIVAALSGRALDYSCGEARVPYCAFSRSDVAEIVWSLRRAGYAVAALEAATGAPRMCYAATGLPSSTDTVKMVHRIRQRAVACRTPSPDRIPDYPNCNC